MEFGGSISPIMKGSKSGRIYLTSHRIIFNNKDPKDKMQSFASPFNSLRQVELEQPVFGANYIKGVVRAQPDGGFTGEAKFKLTFKNGGAIEFGQSMLKIAAMASRHQPAGYDSPPPYTPPEAQWYPAAPPSYAPPTGGYYGWVPPTNVFPDRPPTDGVYMYDAPPPYPGVNGQNGYTPAGFAPTAPASNGVGAPIGFNMNGNDAKAREAAQSAFYDPNNPQYAYVPPPAYNEAPPPYDAATKKSQ